MTVRIGRATYDQGAWQHCADPLFLIATGSCGNHWRNTIMTFAQFAEEFDPELFDILIGYDDVLEQAKAKAQALYEEEKD